MTWFAFDGQPCIYRFRRPIAKPESKWVACTAEEARANCALSQVLCEGEWLWCGTKNAACLTSELAYRSEAQLSEWISFDVYPGRKVRRSDVPLGTVLG